MKIVDKYIIKQFVLSFLFMFLLFIPIGILVDVSEKIDKFKEHDMIFYEVFYFYQSNRRYLILMKLSLNLEKKIK